MPPTSRGQDLLYTLRRYASSTSKSSRTPRTTPKPLPPKPRISNPTISPLQTPRNIKPNAPKVESPVPPSEPQSQYHSRWLPRNPRQRRLLFRVIVLMPTITLAGLHFPFEIMSVNGPSMSPFFNSTYTSDLDPNPPRDTIFVQKYALPDISESIRRERGEEPSEDQPDNYRRGQIVTFRTPHSPDKVAVKRIVGIPGDRVTPLPGYAGGDDAVVVPWNHVWVEGDADSRQKSIDSNWYGPISQNLIIGQVKVVWSSWFSLTWLDDKEQTWPALTSGRVEENIVREASESPQVIQRNADWTNGTNAAALTTMQDARELYARKFTMSEKYRSDVRSFYRNAALVVAASDPESEKHQLAAEFIREMDSLFGKQNMMQGMQKRKRVKDGSQTDAPANGSAATVAKMDSTNVEAALAGEQSLKQQGWTIERDENGKVKSRMSTN